MYRDTTGIILAGGRSSRMGSNKALIPIGGMSVIERIVELLAPLFPTLILSTNSPAEFEFLGLNAVADLQHDVGPLAGIHAGLSASTTYRSFVIPCDVPLMTEAVIRLLVDAPTDCPVTVARADGCLQQLPGVFHRSCVPEIENIIRERSADSEIKTNGKRRGCRITDLFDRIDVRVVDVESEIPGYVAGTFMNMNNAADLEEVRRLIG
jgi:molybdopterin-guanine dinucleotide biosynthesis protein A